MAIGVLISLTASIFLESIIPLYHSIAGLIVGYILGALMFYTGQWGGGDAKMLMAVGSFHGFAIGQLLSGSIPILLTIFLSFLIVGSLYSILYALVLVLANRKLISKMFHERYKSLHKKFFYVFSVVLSLSIILVLLLVAPSFSRTTLLIFIVFILLSYVFLMFGKLVESSILIKTIPLSKVTVGDWIVEDVVLDGTRVCGPKDLGISQKQIRTLKDHDVKSLKVKYGIPFIPGFLLGYVTILIFGNWLSALILLL